MSRFAIVGAALAAGLPVAAAHADTLAVPGDFSTIQAAIDAAEPNDVVLVERGTYRENLHLKSSVDVMGRETAKTMLAPDDDMSPIVAVEGVAGARFSNFTLIDAGIGVSVSASTGIDITNVVFDDASDRAFVADAAVGVSLANNVFFENASALVRADVGVEAVNNIFAGNATTITTTLAFADPFANVRANCFFGNDDLGMEGAGAGATVGEPLFVDPAAHDFHLREGSACIDVGRGIDVIDATVADAGVHGGEFADLAPAAVGQPELEATGTMPPALSISWPPNLSYRVTNSVNPGSYRVYYKSGGAPDDNVPSAYDGSDAGGGTLPSPVEAGAETSYTLEGLTATAPAAPLAPVLREAAGRDEAVGLRWEAVEGATAYRVYYGTSAATENSVDAGDVTSYVVTGLANGTMYRFAVSALAQPSYTIAISALDNTPSRHESTLSPPATAAVGDAAESGLSQELTATPERVVPYPDLEDESGCFIATAAFGAEWKPEVLALRDFRDRYLLTNVPGRWLVARYYALSPPAARYLNEHAALKPAVRAALWPLVIVALVALEGSRAASLALVVLMVSGVVLRVRVRRLVSKESDALYLSVLVPVSVSGLIAWGAFSTAPAFAEGAPDAPRWMYRIEGGVFEPDLDRFATFFGSDHAGIYGLAAGYRFRDWLELDAEIGRVRERGTGTVASGDVPAGAVTYELVPVQLFATFTLDRPERRLVPYLRLGIATALYDEDVELQPSREGRGDVGPAAGIGFRWRFASRGSRDRRPGGPSWRSYVFVEAQRFSSDADTVDGGRVDLGGTSYLTGIRVEFELGGSG